MVSFAVALKHKLRFKPYTDYDDLAGLVGYLDTYAREATRDEHGKTYGPDPGLLKRAGEFPSLSLATSTRKIVKRTKHLLGNLNLVCMYFPSCLALFSGTTANGQSTTSLHSTMF